MKVLQIISSPRAGGTEIFALNLTRGLIKRGVQAYLLNLWDPSELHQTGMVMLNDNYKYLPSWGYWVGPRCLLGILRCIRKEKFDVVHIYALRLSLIIRIFRFLLPCKVMCIGIRGLDQGRKKMQSLFDKLTEGLIDGVVCNARAVAQVRLRREGTPSGKITVIPNGIDVDFFDPSLYKNKQRSELGINHKGFLIACVANFRPEKDHSNLIKAVALLRNRINDVKILLIGQGDLRQYVENMIHTQSLEDYFILSGARSDIPEILSVCDAFVLSSQSEGMPRALMEAMAMQLPVIASDAGGIPEVVENGVSGIIVPKRDSRALSEAMLKIIEDRNYGKKLAMAGRKRIVEKFSLAQMVDKHLNFYQTLMECR